MRLKTFDLEREDISPQLSKMEGSDFSPNLPYHRGTDHASFRRPLYPRKDGGPRQTRVSLLRLLTNNLM